MIRSSVRNVACAMSGGVDSSVAAYLLKNRGFEVTGVFMKNWDLSDEKGTCSAEQDKEDAAYVCNKLGIPFVETNFVKNYWNDVFSELIQGYENGKTPNPDVLCNRHIKFGVFHQHLRENMGFDAIATGHYAQNSAGNYLENLDKCKDGVRLLVAKDAWKDQTIPLSQIQQTSLQRTMFPVGSLLKRDVKRIAQSVDLDKVVRKRESTGICFVGKRDFDKFIEEYIEPKRGLFVDIESGKVLGEHKGTHFWTIGQRAHIAGLNKAYFIAKLNAKTQVISVAPGTRHPALYFDRLYTNCPHWIHEVPNEILHTGMLNCEFKYQHLWQRIWCKLKLIEENGQIKGEVLLDQPVRAFAKGQYAVFYREDECLGSAEIEKTGPSMYDLNVFENEVPENIKIPFEAKIS